MSTDIEGMRSGEKHGSQNFNAFATNWLLSPDQAIKIFWGAMAHYPLM